MRGKHDDPAVSQIGGKNRFFAGRLVKKNIARRISSERLGDFANFLRRVGQAWQKRQFG